MNTTERKPTGRKLLESRRIAQAKAGALIAAAMDRLIRHNTKDTGTK